LPRQLLTDMRLTFVFSLVTLFIATSCSPKLSTGNSAADQFDTDQRSLITSAAADEPMRVFKITNREDSILLRTASERVQINPNDRTLQLFIDRLLTTVQDSMSLGVGIAAPQVGILKNIIWVQRFDKADLPWEVFINPVIVQYSDLTRKGMEGCLSIPDRREECQRSYAILIEYDRPDGSHHTEMVEDFTAVIFQHEIDHLNGILYLDHLASDLAED
ncbi:MAG: peptide deformylase, partial [Bacteroidota bacterium]